MPDIIQTFPNIAYQDLKKFCGRKFLRQSREQIFFALLELFAEFERLEFMMYFPDFLRISEVLDFFFNSGIFGLFSIFLVFFLAI